MDGGQPVIYRGVWDQINLMPILRRGKLVGVFTDGDLRRLVEHNQVDFRARVGKVMTRNPRTVRPEALVGEATRVLRAAAIDQVPVVDGREVDRVLLARVDPARFRFLFIHQPQQALCAFHFAQLGEVDVGPAAAREALLARLAPWRAAA